MPVGEAFYGGFAVFGKAGVYFFYGLLFFQVGFAEEFIGITDKLLFEAVGKHVAVGEWEVARFNLFER
jgi:hypothetical protein